MDKGISTLPVLEPESCLLPIPPFPPQQPTTFRATLHGTVFSGRERHLDDMEVGESLLLRPSLPVEVTAQVWVHLENGELVGHLPAEIADWLAPWLQAGGLARARALRVSGEEVPSWRRVLVEVECGTASSAVGAF